MVVLPPDYDTDPERWQSWKPPQDVHQIVAAELKGPVLDAACGDGRLASLLTGTVRWVGIDSSPTQLAANLFRPIVQGDISHLPFADGSFGEVTHLWCLYHLDDPIAALEEAERVLRPGGRYFASTAARNTDPELVPEGHPASTFDAEDAVEIVSTVFDVFDVDRWDGVFYSLQTREEVRAYCRHSWIPTERADSVSLPLRLTKRGVLIRATKA
jgi:SAM-dependent methyltransferase